MSLLTRLRYAAIPAIAAASILLPSAAGVAHADERDFTLTNNSSAVLTHLYVSPTSSEDWGDDILGRDVLAQGEATMIVFNRYVEGGCLYDILTNYNDGGTGKMMGVDLCSTTDVSFSDAA